jgi:tol-pal system protein YbgF
MKTSAFRVLVLAALALPSAAAAQRVDPVYVEDRLNQLQQSVTLLTGQIEQLQYQNQQLQQKMEKMQADYEYRLEQLEKGGARPGGAPAAPRAAAPDGSGTLAPPAGGSQSRTAVAPTGPAQSQAGADQLYHDAFKLLQDGDYAGAEKSFRTFVQRHPQHPLAGNAQYWLGETFYARRDYQNAAVAFAEGYKVYKASPKGPDNLLKLGITLSTMGKKQEACAMFARFNQDYPRATDLQKRRVSQERQKNRCG